jgi:hypothetical protein
MAPADDYETWELVYDETGQTLWVSAAEGGARAVVPQTQVRDGARSACRATWRAIAIARLSAWESLA